MSLDASKERLVEIIRSFPSIEIAVVGDVILDSYLSCHAAGIANEAPVPLLELLNQTDAPGGAANVAANLAAVGVNTRLVGPVGNDAEAELLKRLLDERHVRFHPLVVPRPTPHKTRVAAGQHYYLRLDEEEDTPLTELEGTALKQLLGPALEGAAALLVSDYDKGTLTASSARHIEALAQKSALPVFADLKPQNVQLFHRLSLITPNLAEARDLAARLNPHSPPADAMKIASNLSARLSCNVVLKMSEQGLAAVDKGGEQTRLQALCRRPLNVAGAGDTVVSVLAAALAAGARLSEAAFLANLAASVAVRHEVTHAVSADELMCAVEGSAV